jgi:hypothetical protein
MITEIRHLRELAETFRRYAAEAGDQGYRRKLIVAALELEALADDATDQEAPRASEPNSRHINILI